MYLFLFISWLSVAGALSVAFPPEGTPTAGDSSQTISCTRDKSAPPPFIMQKIKLDNGDAPGPPSVPVYIQNSQGSKGKSPFPFEQSGLFQVIAVDKQGKTFFSTEVTVLPNLTSSGSPSSTAATSTSTDKGPNSVMMQMTPSTSPVVSSHTPAIIGGVIAGVAVLFIIGATLLCLRYRTRRDTSMFAQSKMLRLHDPVPVSSQWSASPMLEKDLEYYPSSTPMGKSALRPQDSVSNIYFLPPVLPPIPAARSGTSSDDFTPISTPSSLQRTRDRNTPRLSVTTQSTSTSGSGSLFPVPSLPPRTRTERQMIIEEDIQRHQARILFLQGDSGEVSPISRLEREQELVQTNARVELLKRVHESYWALGLTDDVPEEL